MKIHYFDHHTATKPLCFLEDPMWLSTNTLYADSRSQEIGKELEVAVASMLGSDWKMSVTSDGAEAIAAALYGHYRTQILLTGRNHLLYFKDDDAPILHMMDELRAMSCYPKATTVEELEKSINPRVSLLSFSWANGLTGEIRPLQEIAKLCKKHKIRIQLDISRAVGKLNVEELPVDYITVDGSLIRAPTSCGLLLSKEGLPQLVPGRDTKQERVLALLTTVQHHKRHGMEESLKVAHLREHFEKNLEGAKLLFTSAERLQNVSCVEFEDIKNELMLFYLSQQQIFPSIGGGSMQLLQHTVSSSALSFAFSPDQSVEQIDEVVGILHATREKLSPLWSAR